MPTIEQNLQRLINATSNIANAITTKGGTVTQGDGLEEFASDIATIPSAGTPQTKTATPTFSQQTIEPDTGYSLTQVTVNPIPITEIDNEYGGKTVIIG